MTKRQIWRRYVLVAIVLGITFGGLSMLVGWATNLTVQIVFLVWHAYYFNDDGSPKRAEELR